MAVIVSSSISKSGAAITGDTPHLVVVQTYPATSQIPAIRAPARSSRRSADPGLLDAGSGTPPKGGDRLLLFPPRRAQAWRRRVRRNRHSPLRPRTAFAEGGDIVCSPDTEFCRVHPPPGDDMLLPPARPQLPHAVPGGGCCDPCDTLSRQRLPDVHCGPGPVAKTAKCCCTSESGGVVCGNDCCRTDQQCLSPRRSPTAPSATPARRQSPT